MATLWGGQVVGAPEGDEIRGFGDDFTLYGRGGDDTIWGSGDGAITGGQGDDVIFAKRGDVSISGDGGDDVIHLQETVGVTVTLNGGAGSDALVIDGFNTLFGSAFTDFERIELNGVLWASESQLIDSVGRNLIEIGSDRWSSACQLVIGIEGDRMNLSNFEFGGVPADALSPIVLWGDETGDEIIGSKYSDYIDGYGGDDKLSGRGSRDGLNGREGADTLAGGEGDDDLDGGDDDDRLFGGDGNDWLLGGSGADFMAGGEGDDLYWVDDVADVLRDGAGRGTDTVSSSISYTLGGGLENLTLRGTDNLNATGNGAANVLVGNAGANVLDGGRGADTLTGGDGLDRFAFSSKLGLDNVDHVTDFADGDRLILDSKVFAGLSAGGLASRALVIGAEAQDANDRILYDAATGSLWFDRDGSGETQAVLFAVLDDAPDLASGDFVIV